MTYGTPSASVCGMSRLRREEPVCAREEPVEMVEGAIFEKDHDQVIDGHGFGSADLTGRARNRYRRGQILGPGVVRAG